MADGEPRLLSSSESNTTGIAVVTFRITPRFRHAEYRLDKLELRGYQALDIYPVLIGQLEPGTTMLVQLRFKRINKDADLVVSDLAWTSKQ